MPSVTYQPAPQEEPAPAKSKTPVSKDDGRVSGDQTDIEVPFMDYNKAKGSNFLVDHFDLGSMWEETFGEEVKAIENYLVSEIEQGRLDNSTNSVKEVLKKSLKVCGADKTDRKIVQMGLLAKYLEFMTETKKVRSLAGKYGSS